MELAMATRVTREGQVTIPKRVPDYLRIEPGSMVGFDVTPEGRIVLINLDATPQPSRFAKVRGTATVKIATDELMAMTRGED
jgi:AbrB family looped-hinge helix DNA binding protein